MERGISEKARAALEKIGLESNLNRFRVTKYGLSLDDHKAEPG